MFSQFVVLWKIDTFFRKKNDEIYVEAKLIAKNAGKRMKVDVNVANQLGVHFTHHSNCYQLIFALDNCKCHLFGMYVFDSVFGDMIRLETDRDAKLFQTQIDEIITYHSK